MNLQEQPSLTHLILLLEARDDFLIQTFGQKLVDKVTDENQRGMPLPTDLTATLKVVDDTPPANKIVAWFVANDPIQGKGSQWMIVQYIRGNYQLEDIDQVKHTLTEFVRVRTQLSVKDLGQYKTLQALNDALEPFQDKKVVSKREARKSTEIDPTIRPQIDIKLDTGDILIAVPTTHKASMYLASTDFMGSLTGYRAANWCTARDASNYYDSHTRQGPLYFIFIKSGPDAGKYQFHFETSQFHTSANSRIPNLRGWLARNPEIRQVFETKAAERGLLEFLSPEAVIAYRKQYLDSGAIVQLAKDDQATILYLPETQRNLHALLMGTDTKRSYCKWNDKSTKVHTGAVTSGVMYIELADHSMFTYKLGYSSVLHNDATPYPVKNLMKRVPLFKELVTTLLQQAGIDSSDQTDPAIQEMISSGAAKQVFSTDAVTAWWVNGVASFQRYFGVKGLSLQRFYADTALIPQAGIMLLDVGTTLVSYRLGDKTVFVLDTDTLTDDRSGYVSVETTPVIKFMVEYPAVVPIIKKYADHYGYYPLMSDKAKAKRMVELEEQGVISIIQKDSPSIIQLKTADSADLVRPLMVMHYQSRSSDAKKSLAAEIKRGPVFLIQGTIILTSSLGGTYQINSNNGAATVSTKQVFERFPALRTILKDQLATAGVQTDADTPQAEVLAGLEKSGAVTTLLPNPLVVEIKTIAGARWFAESGPKTPTPTDVAWGDHGIVTPYDEVFTSEGARQGAAPMPGTKVFGFTGKGGVPLILSAKKATGGSSTAYLNLYMTFEDRGGRNKNITTTQGVVAYMQKYPDVVRAILPRLEDGAADAAQELSAIGGASQGDPFSQTAGAITGIMKALKTTTGRQEAQAVSELNADKFNKGCYNAAAYLKQYAGQFTYEQAQKTAERIINVMKYTSKESLRTMPLELAEWLKYATQLSPTEAQRIVRAHPVFVAGLQPAPISLMRDIYTASRTDNIEVARAFARMDPNEERILDREIFDSRTVQPIGVDYNNVRSQAEEYVQQHGMRNAFKNKLFYMRNVPADKTNAYMQADGTHYIQKMWFPTDDAVLAAFARNSYLATAKRSGGVPFSRRSPKVRAAIRYIRQHGSLTGFSFTPPAPVQLPRVGGAAPARTTRQPAPRQAAEPTPRQGDGGGAAAAGFATKAAYARHIIDNRTPEDTRTSLIRRLITDVGLTPAGAATYYYNLTRGAVREGDEMLDLFTSTLKSLFY